ncbi:MAG TPA: acyltransferase family protein [Solirubrobacterales bacterium]|nr:acyltransferase family protein [Solirubrobacterales bacterium]
MSEKASAGTLAGPSPGAAQETAVSRPRLPSAKYREKAGLQRPGLTAFPDVAKVVAIFGIVTIHVAAPASEGFGILTDRAWASAVALETATRWSVPLFVMVSGMLLLTGKTVEESPLVFYRRRAARIAIPLVAWTLFYRLYLEHTGPQASFLEHVQAIYSGQPYYHLYFLFVIGGLYLIAPFLARVVNEMSQRQLGLISAGALLLGFLWMGVPPWLPGTGANAFSLFAPYVGFFLAGRWLGRAKLDRELAWWCAGAFLVLFVSTAFETYLWVHAEGLENGRYFYGYLSPPVILMSLAIFVVIRYLVEQRERRRPVRHMKALHFLGEATFGIYLIHPYFFTLFQRHYAVPSALHTLAWWWPATVIGLVLVSFACTVAIKQIPGLRRIV